MFDPGSRRGWVNEMTVAVNNLTQVEGKKLMIATAERERDRVLAGSPRPFGYDQYVNFVEGASLSAVTFNGVVVFVWKYLQLVAEKAYEALVMSSPIRSGNYVKQIHIIIDDDFSTRTAWLTDITPDTRKIWLVPGADYARRLEVGLKDDGTTPFVVQVPLHNVELVARMLQRRFGGPDGLADISFNYVDLPGAWVLSRHFRSRRRQPRETHVRYPAIEIVARTAT